jgi:hypothetical protein
VGTPFLKVKIQDLRRLLQVLVPLVVELDYLAHVHLPVSTLLSYGKKVSKRGKATRLLLEQATKMREGGLRPKALFGAS